MSQPYSLWENDIFGVFVDYYVGYGICLEHERKTYSQASYVRY